AMRAKDLSGAKRLLDEALTRAPGDARVLALAALRAELAGDAPGAIALYEKASAASASDLPSRWSAARLSAEQGAAGRERALAGIRSALALTPANAFLLVRLAELERTGGDAAAASATLQRLAAVAGGEPRFDRAIEEARAALASGDAHAADLKSRIVENLLRATPRYQQARHDVEPGVVGLPLEDWSPAVAAQVVARAGAPIPVAFVPVARSGLDEVAGASAVRAFGREARGVAFATDGGLRVAEPAPGGFRLAAPIAGSASKSVEAADVTNSGELDLIAPGALWVSDAGAWKKTALPASGRVPAPAAGDHVVLLDFDADGDLDLYVSSESGDRLLRNNLDGTWTDVTESSGLPRGIASRGAIAADFDRDGDTDLLLFLPSGGFVLYDNLRGGRFAPKESGLPPAGAAVDGAAAGDVDGDGRIDLVWTAGGTAYLAKSRGDGRFGAATAIGPGSVPMLFDFDNDGFLDLLLARRDGASTLWRNTGGAFAPASGAGSLPAAAAAEAVDFDGDGDLDLVLVTPEGRAALFENRGGNAGSWVDVALEGLPTGSAKVNRLGYGSELELRAGDLYVYRTATRPVTRLGLGARRRADVLRVVWTNGVPQNALDPKTRTALREVQQLKGSCPFLYAFDGARWSFVTDVLGRAPAGLLYDGIHQAPADTREWTVIPGDRLAPDPGTGRLSLDVTEELWEAAYLDLAQLSAVDHPAGVWLVPDERMIPPPFPPKRLHTVSRPLTPRASDGEGRDRTAEIAAEDGVYLAGFAPTRYQGIVAPHELVLELPEARDARHVMLYLTGWIFYADTSINVSLSQRGDLRAEPPVLEVPDGSGGWRTGIPAPRMGYPAGKTKTMPVDLSDVLVRSDPRIRIRTNLAISWDRIAYTVDEAPAPMRLAAVPLAAATLSFRGFSRMTVESPGGPQVFVHDDVTREPRWADMAGRYTRFGDVRPLLTGADDRYVVMKGGDAVRLEFDGSGLPPVPPGWTRDWLVVLDGWDKDADKNTVAGQTVEPLPFHGMDDARYGEQPFPDSESHREFVREYLTREGGPDEFRDAVRDGARKRKP
ncbi:MAG TPA: FG-GAP-like repeat-containing protein, partial [Thermoanaerobaculia bacterium]|nr:FG-GAP-like repeat-containing protein [Thermoanaerobaculia bacterium]